MSEFIITDAVEEFFDDDAIQRDLDEHPLTWGLALLLVAPAIVLSYRTGFRTNWHSRIRYVATLNSWNNIPNSSDCLIYFGSWKSPCS